MCGLPGYGLSGEVTFSTGPSADPSATSWGTQYIGDDPSTHVYNALHVWGHTNFDSDNQGNFGTVFLGGNFICDIGSAHSTGDKNKQQLVRACLPALF